MSIASIYMTASEYIEPLAGDARITTYPIGRQETFELYAKARNCFWVPAEIQLDKDRSDYENKLSAGEKHFVKTVLGFFASMDGLVNVNIIERFKKDFSIYEVGLFYDFQVAMENIHAETYSLTLDTIISNNEEKTAILNAIETIPIIKRIAEWIDDTIKKDLGIGERIMRMICIEGLLFIGCFCAIYWLQQNGSMPGLAHSNELIARDESLHTLFAIHLHDLLKPQYKLSAFKVHEIIKEAMVLADEFCEYALPKGLKMMNSALMSEYLRHSADDICIRMNVPALYNAKNPFSFMIKQNMANKTLFFDRRVSEYSRSNQRSSQSSEYITGADNEDHGEEEEW